MPFIDVGAGPIEYELIDGASPGLVFLHEGLGSLRLWRSFPRDVCVATGRAGLVYSRHGYGDSAVVTEPRTTRFMHDEALLVLPELLDRLGFADSVLIGHSDGASIAIIAAGEHAVSARALVLIAPHVFLEDETVAGARAALAEFESGLREKLAKHHRDVDATFRGWNDVWLSDELRSWNIEDSLAGIQCPVLVIQGADDRYGTVAQVEAIERGTTAPVRSVVMAGVGHAPHAQAGAETLDAIVGFLGELPPA